jgi:hypothetical protein
MMADLTRDQYIQQELAATGMKDTKANRNKLGKEYDQKYLGGDRGDWRTYFKVQFPQLADMLDGGAGEQEARAVFGDLIDLFIDIANNPDQYDFASEAGRNAFKNKVSATKYAQQTTQKRAEWDALKPAEKTDRIRLKASEIRAQYGNLGLTLGEVDRLAANALQNGLSDLELKYLSYGTLAGRQGTPIMETKEAMDLAATLKAYDYKYTPELIEQALTGQNVNGVPMTSELLIDKARFGARLKYSAFTDLFEKGYTVNDVFAPYQEVAAQLLERAPQDISFEKDLYRKALENKNEDGSPMTISQWSRELKSNPDYGWQYTANANRQVSNVVRTIEQAFGFRQ